MVSARRPAFMQRIWPPDRREGAGRDREELDRRQTAASLKGEFMPGRRHGRYQPMAAGRRWRASFGVPIPYAVFFAPGGIAFHAGRLTSSSHGCIHLTLPNARYYHDHLPDGAEVAVF